MKKKSCKNGLSCGLTCINNLKVCKANIQSKFSSLLDKVSGFIKNLFDKDRKDKSEILGDLNTLPTETRDLVSNFIKNNDISLEVAPSYEERQKFKASDIKKLVDRLRNNGINPFKFVSVVETLNAIEEVYDGDLSKAFGFNKAELHKVKLKPEDVARLYLLSGNGMASGFTFTPVNHVVVTKLPKTGNNKSPTDKDYAKIGEEINNTMITKKWFSVSSASSEVSGERMRRLTTFIHELGHRLDFSDQDRGYDISKHSVLKRGYSSTSYEENFAENFALWATQPKIFKTYNPEGYDFFKKFLEDKS